MKTKKTSASRTSNLSTAGEYTPCGPLSRAAACIGAEIVPHPLFKEVRSALQEAMQCHNLLFLIGPSGVGKDTLARGLVDELNLSVSQTPALLNAAMVAAPAPHRQAFSWRDTWFDVLRVLEEPLLERKVDREAAAEGLRPESRGCNAGLPAVRMARSTEGTLHRAVRDAAVDRGLVLLVINEALSLVSSERARSLREQLDVLRNLCDEASFRVLLLSTGRILTSLSLSGELARRVGLVYFPRYGSPVDVRGQPVAADGPSQFKTFSRVVVSFMQSVPDEVRFSPSRDELRFLYTGSLGCAGLLADWFRRALVRCASRGCAALSLEHFEETAYAEPNLRRLCQDCEAGEESVERACARVPFKGRPRPAGAVPGEEPAPVRARRSRRPGTPDPTRRAGVVRAGGSGS